MLHPPGRLIAVAGIAGAALLGLSACTSAAPPASPTGTWGDADDPQQPSLVLAEDGGVSGTDGCNTLVGQWSGDGERIDFGPMVSTQMYCEGIDDWLTKAAAATVSGDTMTVLDESGTEIGTLTRS